MGGVIPQCRYVLPYDEASYNNCRRADGHRGRHLTHGERMRDPAPRRDARVKGPPIEPPRVIEAISVPTRKQLTHIERALRGSRGRAAAMKAWFAVLQMMKPAVVCREEYL